MIEWELDLSEPACALDPVGNILIYDGQSRIEEKVVFLDSWFLALIECLRQTKMQGTADIEIGEHRRRLKATATGPRMALFFGDRELHFDLRQFERDLLSAAKDFVDRIRELDPRGSNSVLEDIRAHVQGGCASG
jgi:hypothetical protein